MKKRSVRTVLMEARALIKRGWCRGNLYVNGAYCAVGAIRKSSYGCVLPPPYRSRNNLYSKATLAISRALSDSADGKRSASRIQWWNDHQASSQAEVLRLFDKAIKAAEAA